MTTVYCRKKKVGLFWWLDQNKLQPTWTKAAGSTTLWQNLGGGSVGAYQRGREGTQVVVAPEWAEQIHSQHLSLSFWKAVVCLVGRTSCVGAVPGERVKKAQGDIRWPLMSKLKLAKSKKKAASATEKPTIEMLLYHHLQIWELPQYRPIISYFTNLALRWVEHSSHWIKQKQTNKQN